ncbi:hypothetical protein [Sphingobacterium athyrii]|uniref:Carboxypeptidase-like regulatory domain-containing protein n=1 Tax=Sphingobacterium athyrii TaxID=2152717 RepID=A0A363NQU3_9SPHI|nr:hypothetical protein [Sphingobacterium athyrii]PUV23133.1 hypothetical protein DCO56_19675 [Sphingobacterium athyrii]
MEKIILQVKESCIADWGKMTAQEQGRFCGKCEKIVVDFSQMSDQEIVDQIKKSSKGLCGRFYEDQLLRELDASFSFAKNPVWLNRWNGIAAGLMLIGSLSLPAVQAQTFTTGKVAVVQTKDVAATESVEKLTIPSQPLKSEPALSNQDSIKVKISGKIVCASGEGSMTGTDVSIGDYHTKAGENGSFEFWVPQSLFSKDQELRAQMIGYKTVVVRLKKGNKKAINKPIKMEVRPMIMGLIATSDR